MPRANIHIGLNMILPSVDMTSGKKFPKKYGYFMLNHKAPPYDILPNSKISKMDSQVAHLDLLIVCLCNFYCVAKSSFIYVGIQDVSVIGALALTNLSCFHRGGMCTSFSL